MIQRFLTPILGQLAFKCRIDNQNKNYYEHKLWDNEKMNGQTASFKTRKTDFYIHAQVLKDRSKRQT